MPIRELTDAERDRLLTQEEVNGLEEGATVCVKWNGGNGPHKYTIGFRDGFEEPFAEDTRTGELTGPPLDYVGTDPDGPRQRVFLPDAEE